MKTWLKGGLIGLILGLITDILIGYLGPLVLGNLLNSNNILGTSCLYCIFTDYIKLLIFVIIGFIIGSIIGNLKTKGVMKK
jgi:hypothetical protein